MNFRLKPLAAVVAMVSAGVAFPALADSVLEGRISDQQNSTVYTGAVVRIEELNREVLAGNAGRFRLPQLKAGSYTLTVIVGGKEVERRAVSVADNEIRSVDIILNQADDQVEEVLVIGQAAQMQRALDRQRFADNSISVVNADAIGQLPDANAAEALQRVPGLSIERDQGEGRFVRVRGISPDLNAVTVNGTQLPAPEAGRRAVALDVIPSDLVSALVVSKTLTPDMDANAIGGSIEVESLSALDREGAFYTLRAEASYDEQTEQTSPAYGISGGNTFTFSNGQRLGVAAALSYDDHKFGSENIETGGNWDDDKKIDEFEIRDYEIERERLGAALNFDYEIDMNNRLFLRTLYSSFKDFETRQASVVSFDDPLASGETGDGTVSRELKDREETQKILSTTFGGEHFAGDWTIKYALGYSEASEDNPGGLSAAAFESDFSGLGYTGTRKPHLIAPADYYDAANYEIDAVKYAESYTDDTQTSLRLDLARDLFIAGYPSQIKFGGKYQTREKTNDEDVYKFKDFNGETLDTLSNGAVDYSLSTFGPGISPSAIYNLIGSMDKADAYREDDSRIADYSITEDVTAAYLMTTVDMDDLYLLAGVRYEATAHDFDGVKYNANSEEFSDYTDDNQYSHVLPNIQARYRLAEDTQLRAAWTNSVVRPTFEQMAPSLSSEDDEAESGNPQLDAMTAANFDLGIEHYIGTASALSAALFYKDIKDFIYQADIAGQPGFTEFDSVDSYDNGDNAKLNGLELSASQKLEMLPAPFDGLLLSANVTVSDSEATLKYDGGSRTIALPNQSDVTGNLVIGYEKNGLMLRLATNYKSEYLMEVGDVESKDEDIYQAAQTQLDFSAAYDISERVKVNFAIANLTDEPYYTYQGQEKYNAQFEDYGPTYRLGVSFSNF
ncbi:TonB-dependent receptor [Thalassolituus sp. LLYu03]|uniref:TonB-dependent receptor n=1 Tax=Thalassolituus sp. LLYu03 TaxID=3421656 RepID=UPI003D264F0D